MACPLGVRCESCGAEQSGLSVKTMTAAAGVLCLTLCPACARSTVLPPITVGTAARLVDQHRRHTGGSR
jgi:hypothetical protein